MPKPKSSLIQVLKSILNQNETIGTQQDLCDALLKQGHAVTQSSLSRLLRKMGVVKVTNQQGQLIYNLPQTPHEPQSIHSIAELVIEIIHNETMIVIHTNPGSASLIASILDHHKPHDLLGTVAGDDTIFIIPQSIHQVTETVDAINKLLYR